MTKGERIVALREKKDMQQIELANEIGVSKQTMYKYETGIVTNIPSDKIELMANALHTSPAYIMGWTEDQRPFGEEIDRQEKASKIEYLFSLLSDDQQKLVTDLIENLLATRKQ